MPLLAPATLPYVGLFTVAALVCFVIVLRSRSTEKVTVTSDFKKFQRNFLLVYLIMFMADWMQGPYVYALYNSYGFEHSQIAMLFMVGFGSSMIVGTFVGGLADRFGRKANCILFGVLYTLSCATKHFDDFWILMLGRVLGGVSTSILYSAFEAWMVHEHNKNGLSQEWMLHTFSWMTFGNGLVAIVAGIVASTLASQFSLVAPFDASAVLLVIGTIVVATTWTENYGDQFSTGFSNFRGAVSVLMSNEKVALLGLIQSCFESAMYLFVFEWTPALEATLSPDLTKTLPHGVVFATFMVCIMIGSRCLSTISNYQPVEYTARFVFLAAAIFLAVPVFISNHIVHLIAFCGFEICCGFYFPCIGSMRSKYVPKEVRATLMNVFRIGLNLIVVLVLANSDKITQSAVFVLCSLVLCICAIAQQRLFALSEANLSASDRAKSGLEAGEEVDESLQTKEDLQA